jgi:pSer/pThr/pTyr-binding forkhead associated (FHA) protein
MTAEPRETRIAAGALLRGDATAGPHLIVLDGPDAGRALALGGSLTVGRAREADLKLSDPSTSRLHARLTLVGGRVVATDLRSKNGMLVNGAPCRAPRPLEFGDELVIGATRLTLEPGLLDATLQGASATGEAPPVASKEAASTRTWSAPLLLAAAVALIAAVALLAP